jgi:uncharacterized protein (DUF983 family)
VARQYWNFISLLTLRCPYCGQDTFRNGLFRTADTCARCGHRFESEPGLFAGAIYPMYGLGGFTGGAAGLAAAALGASFPVILAAAFTAVLLASPYIFWVSRLSFLHANHRFFSE